MFLPKASFFSKVAISSFNTLTVIVDFYYVKLDLVEVVCLSCYLVYYSRDYKVESLMRIFELVYYSYLIYLLFFDITYLSY